MVKLLVENQDLQARLKVPKKEIDMATTQNNETLYLVNVVKQSAQVMYFYNSN